MFTAITRSEIKTHIIKSLEFYMMTGDNRPIEPIKIQKDTARHGELKTLYCTLSFAARSDTPLGRDFVFSQVDHSIQTIIGSVCGMCTLYPGEIYLAGVEGVKIHLLPDVQGDVVTPSVLLNPAQQCVAALELYVPAQCMERLKDFRNFEQDLRDRSEQEERVHMRLEAQQQREQGYTRSGARVLAAPRTPLTNAEIYKGYEDLEVFDAMKAAEDIEERVNAHYETPKRTDVARFLLANSANVVNQARNMRSEVRIPVGVAMRRNGEVRIGRGKSQAFVEHAVRIATLTLDPFENREKLVMRPAYIEFAKTLDGEDELVSVFEVQPVRSRKLPPRFAKNKKLKETK